MTFSIVGHCSRTGMAGVAITTSSIAVGSRCPHVRAGAGAVTTQNVTDPSIGPEVLALMASGAAASEAIATVMDGRPTPPIARWRPWTRGRVAHVTGEEILGTNAVSAGIGCVAAGNLLSTAEVPTAMTRALSPVMSSILPNAFSRLLKRGSRRVARKGRRIRRRFLSPMSRAGHLSIFALTGPKRARGRFCGHFGTLTSRRWMPTVCGLSIPPPRRATVCLATNSASRGRHRHLSRKIQEC